MAELGKKKREKKLQVPEMKSDLKIKMVRIRIDANFIQERSKEEKWNDYQQAGAWLLISLWEQDNYQPGAQMREEIGSELLNKGGIFTNKHTDVRTQYTSISIASGGLRRRKNKSLNNRKLQSYVINGFGVQIQINCARQKHHAPPKNY